MRTRASAVSGYDRSTIRSSTNAASAARARPAEIDPAMSAGVVLAGTTRLEPSGSVTVMSLMVLAERDFRGCAPPSLAPRAFGAATFAWLANRSSRSPLARVSRDGDTGRLELPTSCVSSRRSNQLSYAPIPKKLALPKNDSLAESGETDKNRQWRGRVWKARRKPKRRIGSSLFSGSALVQRRLERLARAEADDAPLGNLDGCPGLRVARSPGFALGGLERAESDEGDRLALLRDLVIPSMNESTAAAALTLLSPVSSATLEINSVLFMRPSEQEAEDVCAA